MGSIKRSLKGLMMINRGRFGNLPHNPVIPIIPPYTPPIPTIPANVNPPIVQLYVTSDFGDNAINNHFPEHASHSEKNQTIFNYITRNFRNRCTSFESYKTPLLGNNFVGDELNACKTIKADIIYTPYVNAAAGTNTDNENLILIVGSHYDNDGQGDVQVGNDNNRHDITVDSSTFLSDSIAVSARRDTPELFKNSTSEGYGMEFFEDCSPEALNPYYPDKDVPLCFWECNTNIDGTILSNARTQTNSQTIDPAFNVGQEVWVIKSDGTKESTIITSFIDSDNFNISPALTPIIGTTLYSWRNDTLGEYINAQAESWAVPAIAAKLKVIKMTTNSDWDTVRAAARATAKRNATNIPEIDNANWDIYRGFGCIDVDSAIQYINNI